MDSDPNNDPEFVRLFTITESDEDEDSDEEGLTMPWQALTPAENPYDRTARVQQANRELFTQPFVKKKLHCKVHFDLIPQKLTSKGQEAGDGESMSLDNASNNQSQLQRRDTSRVALPRRYRWQQYTRAFCKVTAILM